MKFSAVAEVHSSAVDDEGDPSVVCTSRQWSAVVALEHMKALQQDLGHMDSMIVPEPLEHSVVGVPLTGGGISVDRVASGPRRKTGRPLW